MAGEAVILVAFYESDKYYGSGTTANITCCGAPTSGICRYPYCDYVVINVSSPSKDKESIRKEYEAQVKYETSRVLNKYNGHVLKERPCYVVFSSAPLNQQAPPSKPYTAH